MNPQISGKQTNAFNAKVRSKVTYASLEISINGTASKEHGNNVSLSTSIQTTMLVLFNGLSEGHEENTKGTPIQFIAKTIDETVSRM